MNSSRISKAFLLLILSLVLFLVACSSQENISKHTALFPLFFILILIDVYLWRSNRALSLKVSLYPRLILRALFWTPMAMLLVYIASGLFFKIHEWNPAFRTYFVALILIGYFTKLLPAVFLGMRDGRRLILRLFQKKSFVANDGKEISRSKFFEYAGLLGGGLVFSSMLTGMIRWVYDFKIYEEKIPIKGLSSEFEDFKIVQISDLHLGSWASGEPLNDAMDMILDTNPDLIVFTGDLVNYTTQEAFPFEDILARLSKNHTVLCTLGNHDYGEYSTWDSEEEKESNMTDLYSFYKRIGWKLLNNESHIIERNGEKLAIVGVENWGDKLRFPKRGNPVVALNGVESNIPKILLSHDPSHWTSVILPEFPQFELTLAGHTHGAQFGIETGALKWSPVQYIYKHWAGLYQQNGQYLYVNRGIGHIGYPGRIGILPEITLLRLQSRS